MALGVVALSTALNFLLRPHLGPIDHAMIFLLGVVVVAALTPQGPGILASFASVAVFDFLFVPPYYTFDVHDTSYLTTFGVMLVVTLLMTRLTSKVREQAEEANLRARRAAEVAALTHDLAEASGREESLQVAARHLGRAAGGEATILLAEGGLAWADSWPGEALIADHVTRLAAIWAHRYGDVAGAGTTHCGDSDAVVVPLRSTRRIGVAIVAPPDEGPALPPPDAALLVAMGERIGAALDRAALLEQHHWARIEAEGERLRTALLSSLSHDLRTPLASIEGAATALLQPSLPAESKRELTETILEEARRMARLVANLLDMIRVEAGTLAVRKQWQPLEECLGVALLRLDERLRGYPVEVDLPPDLPLVPIDEVLLEQVFINLLENAARYCPPGTPVAITAAPIPGEVEVTVADRGPGIPEGAEEAVFRKFYRAGSVLQGAGLGLTICRGIVTAHGGRMWVERGVDGGAAFRFTLPLDGPRLPVAPVDRVESAAAAIPVAG